MTANAQRQQDAEFEGYYFKLGTDFVGVYNSSQGMKLFYNRDIYRLDELCWDAELVAGERRQLFSFYWRGEVKISLSASAHFELFIQLYQLLDRSRGIALPAMYGRNG